MTTTVELEALPSLVGMHLGYSDWVVIDQRRVNAFAEATGDHQWIHVEPERAKSGPFGGPVAHGYLSLSLVPALLEQVLDVEDAEVTVNYGANRVRFPAPMPVGAEARLGVTVTSVEPAGDGAQAVLDVTVEARDAQKPSCVAQVIYRYSR